MWFLAAMLVWTVAAIPIDAASAAPSCPESGSPDAVLNEWLRAWPDDRIVVILLPGDFEALQRGADRLFGHAGGLTAEDRGLLRNMLLDGDRVSEGDFVQITGYIVGVPRDRPAGEDCRDAAGARPTSKGLRVAIGARLGAGEQGAIWVEVSPEHRPAQWTVQALQAIAGRRRPVLVRGRLVYGTSHGGPSSGDSGRRSPRRLLWEIHPVTELYVCPASSCDPRLIADWDLVGRVR